MNIISAKVLGALVVVLMSILGYIATVQSPVAPGENALGAATSNDFTQPVTIQSSITYLAHRATTTNASLTFITSDLDNVDTISIYPAVGDVTITLPASSTLSRILPTNGASRRICVYNATTTTGIDITFAAGTGIDLEVASSTNQQGSGAAVLTLEADNSGCFEFQKKGGSGTSASDILARWTRFTDGD